MRPLLKKFADIGWFVSLLMLVEISHAQSPGTGAIAGSVTDQSGAVIAKATVTAVNVETHAARALLTSSEGAFRLSLLTPGTYSLSAEATGFAAKHINAIHVGVSETVSLNLSLAIGTNTETLEVSSVANLAQAESATLGRVTDQSTIRSLPLANRNYTQIIALSPGVLVDLA